MPRRQLARRLAAFLAVAAAAGGAFTFVAHRRAELALEGGGAVVDALERFVLTIADVASAQQAYVAPGQPDQPWLERSAALLQQLAADAAAVHPRLRSIDASTKFGDVERALQGLTKVDADARAQVTQGQNVLAADMVFNEGRESAAALTAAVRALQADERSAWAEERARAEGRQWLSIGGTFLVWMAGLLILLRRDASAGASTAPAATTDPLAAAPAVSPAPVAETARPGLDLSAAADVCAQLARVSDPSGLRSALERAAAVLDARGFVVWMRSGEQLFPVFAHGYDDRLLRRLGPIARSADNATADAWRSGEPRAVVADVMTHGAIVAPMTSPAGCVGVFAAEVRRGRETDPAARAVVVMIAAQLAGAVAAWPPASAEAASTP